MSEPLILVSSKAHAYIESTKSVVLPRRPCRMVSIETATEEELRNIDIALITRDVTGLSTKHVLSAYLQRFYVALDHAPCLRWVHTHSAGLDRPIFGELQAKGIKVTASSGANAPIVAHTALAGVLALARRFPQLMKSQAKHEWSSLIGASLPRDLQGQSAVVVGWGPIGQYLGTLLQAVGMEIIVVRNRLQALPDAKATVTYGQIKSVLPQADWLLLVCPLSSSTSRLIDAEAFSLLPYGAHIINVARGEVVVQEQMVSALRDGRLAGAFLDVFEREPLDSESPLWDMENVIVTPHSAGHSSGNYGRVIDIFMEKLGTWTA